MNDSNETAGPATVFRNGPVYTADRQAPWTEAVAIRGARVLATGKDAEVRRVAGSDAAVVDLAGGMAMPGIIDMHNHALEGARAQLFEFPLQPSQPFDAVIAAVRTAAAKTKPGDWILGAGWGPAVAEKFLRADALRLLDEAAPDNPVLLKDISYHSRIANSKAMAAADKTAVEREARKGEIACDPSTGQWTGLFHEAAGAAMDAAAPAWTDDQLLASARHSLEIMNSLGLTGFNLAVASRRTMTAYRQLDDAGEMTARMAGYIDHRSPLTAKRDGIGAEFVAARGELRTRRVGVDFAKFFMDGVPSQRTSSMLRDYLDGTSGAQSHYSVDELADLIAPLDREGMRVKVHAIGDRAIRDVLDAIEKVRRRNGKGPMHQIAHVNFIPPEDIPRMSALGVVADLCPPLWYPSAITKRLAEVLGADYVALSHPIRALIEAGTLAAAGTDWPAIAPSPSPWPGMATLITRRHPTGDFPGEHRPEQKLDLDTALPMFTINPAIAMGIDNEAGSLTSGKYADLIVLDRNLKAIPPEEIVHTQVVATYFEGRRVYSGA
jgi:predicted amidohydrolase YtcJ